MDVLLTFTFLYYNIVDGERIAFELSSVWNRIFDHGYEGNEKIERPVIHYFPNKVLKACLNK